MRWKCAGTQDGAMARPELAAARVANPRNQSAVRQDFVGTGRASKRHDVWDPPAPSPWREPVTRCGEKNASGRQPGRAARPCFRAWRACRSANPWAASSTQCHPWQMPLTAAGGAYAHDIRAYRKEGVHAGPSTVGSPPAEDNQVGCVSLCSRVYSRAWQRNVPLRSLR